MKQQLKRSSSSWHNLVLDNLKYVWRQPPLNLTKDSHTQHKEQPKTWLGFSLLYLGQNIKLYTSNGLGWVRKFCRKTFCSSFNQSSLIHDRSNQADLHSKSCSNSIPTFTTKNAGYSRVFFSRVYKKRGFSSSIATFLRNVAKASSYSCVF